MFASLRVLSVVFSVLVVLCHTASLVVLGETRSSQSEATLRNYLESSSSSSSSPPSGKFYVQGWRWHTMSLVREAGRLREFAQNLSSSDAEAADTDKLSALKTATEYVVNFNMKGLHSIEKDLFFPWVREKTCNAVEDKDKDVCQAIKNVMDELESDRQKLESVGASLSKKAATAADYSLSPETRLKAVKDLASGAGAITETATSMLEREENFLVPVVAKLVPDSEQKSFNNRVIRKLGIFDSRLHLVSMHEAVRNDKEEERLFRESIPSIPRMMIPRWKRLMYEPRVGALDDSSRTH